MEREPAVTATASTVGANCKRRSHVDSAVREHRICEPGQAAEWMRRHGWYRSAVRGKTWANGQQAYTYVLSQHLPVYVYDHPIWKYLSPYIRRGGLASFRPSDQLLNLALGVVTNCPSCSAVVSPFRLDVENDLACTPCCPGCSETKAAFEHAAKLQSEFLVAALAPPSRRAA